MEDKDHMITVLDKCLEGHLDRLAKIEKLTLEALQTDEAHHKQWYLNEILDHVAGPATRELMICIPWDEGIAP